MSPIRLHLHENIRSIGIAKHNPDFHTQRTAARAAGPSNSRLVVDPRPRLPNRYRPPQDADAIQTALLCAVNHNFSFPSFYSPVLHAVHAGFGHGEQEEPAGTAASAADVHKTKNAQIHTRSAACET